MKILVNNQEVVINSKTITYLELINLVSFKKVVKIIYYYAYGNVYSAKLLKLGDTLKVSENMVIIII